MIQVVTKTSRVTTTTSEMRSPPSLIETTWPFTKWDSAIACTASKNPPNTTSSGTKEKIFFSKNREQFVSKSNVSFKIEFIVHQNLDFVLGTKVLAWCVSLALSSRQYSFLSFSPRQHNDQNQNKVKTKTKLQQTDLIKNVTINNQMQTYFVDVKNIWTR